MYYQDQADAAFWDNYWKDIIIKDYYKRYETGELDALSPFFVKYLRKEDHILEAGCGTAKYVLALKKRGFDYIEGIEWGKETVQRVKSIYPELSIKIGDVTNISVADNYYDAYISIGVVEHRKEGPEPYLLEACRVLKPGGLALISVPYVNPLRFIKGHLGLYRKQDGIDLSFYQYAYNVAEFSNYLRNSGLEVLDAKSYGGYYGLNEELPKLFSFLTSIKGGWRIIRYLKKAPWLDFYGHMMMYICKPEENITSNRGLMKKGQIT